MTDIVLSAAQTAYTLIGSDAACKRIGFADPSSYTYTGQTVNLVYSQNVADKEFPVSAGAYAITGQSLSFARGYSNLAAPSSYILSDEPPKLVRGSVLYSDSIDITVAGIGASFLRTGQPRDTQMTVNIKVRGGTADQWETANPTLLLNEIGLETDTLRMKSGNGYQQWLDLPYSIDKVFTSALFDKLNGIEAGAQANVPVTANDVTDTVTKVMMLAAERTKLGSVAANAQANPTQVSGGERAAGTETNLRSFAPADVKAMVGVHEVRTDNPHAVTKAQVGLGSVSNALQVLASLGYPNKSTINNNDVLLIGDSEAGGALKTITASALPSGGGGGEVADPHTYKIYGCFVGSQVTWANKPTSEQEFGGGQTRIPVDLTNATRIRLMSVVNTAGTTGHKIYLKYTVDNGGTFTSMTGTETAITSTGASVTSYSLVPEGAKGFPYTTYLGLFGDAPGGATASPNFSLVLVEIEYDVKPSDKVYTQSIETLVDLLPNASTYTSMPTGETEWRAGTDQAAQFTVDLRTADYITFAVQVPTAANTGSTIRLQYWNGSAYAEIPGTLTPIDAVTTTAIFSAELPVPDAARLESCQLRLLASGTVDNSKSPQIRAVRLGIGEKTTTGILKNAAVIVREPIVFSQASSLAWTNMPAAETILLALNATAYSDLRTVKAIQLTAAVTAAGASGATIYPRITFDNGATYTSLPEAEIAIDSTGQKRSAVVPIPDYARMKNGTISIWGADGDGVADPAFRMVTLFVEREILPDNDVGEGSVFEVWANDTPIPYGVSVVHVRNASSLKLPSAQTPARRKQIAVSAMNIDNASVAVKGSSRVAIVGGAIFGNDTVNYAQRYNLTTTTSATPVMTITGWFRPADTTTRTIAKVQLNATNYTAVRMNSDFDGSGPGTFFQIISVASGTPILDKRFACSNNILHHVALSVSMNNASPVINCYIDGVAVNPSATSGGGTWVQAAALGGSSGGTPSVGSGTASTTRAWNGLVGGVASWPTYLDLSVPRNRCMLYDGGPVSLGFPINGISPSFIFNPERPILDVPNPGAIGGVWHNSDPATTGFITGNSPDQALLEQVRGAGPGGITLNDGVSVTFVRMRSGGRWMAA